MGCYLYVVVVLALVRASALNAAPGLLHNRSSCLFLLLLLFLMMDGKVAQGNYSVVVAPSIGCGELGTGKAQGPHNS